MGLTTWYQVEKDKPYHLPSADWVTSGLALCGAYLGKVARTYTETGVVVSPTPESLGKERCASCTSLQGSEEVAHV